MNSPYRDLALAQVDAFANKCRTDGLTAFQGGRPYADRPSLWYRMPLATITHGDPCQSDMSNLSVTFASSLFSNTTRQQPALLALGRFHLFEGQHTGMRSLDELMLSAAFCMAHNRAIMFIDVMNADGALYASPYRVFKPVFDILRPMEQFYGGQKLRSVAVYISEDTKNDLYESGAKHTIIDWDKTRTIDAVEIYTDGLYESFRAFLDHQVPVDAITKLNLGNLDKYSMLVLPETTCMSDVEVEQVHQLVKHGENLLASRSTSLADEDGNRRHNFALEDVFEADYLGETENNETYVKVPPELCRQANIPDDMEVKVDHQTIVRAKAGADVLGHIVLPHTNRANDMKRWIGCWGSPPGVSTDCPDIVMNRYGEGKCCYVSFQVHTLDPLFSVEEPRALLYTLAHTMIADKFPFLVSNAPSWLLVTGYRQPEAKRLLVHLVNAQQGAPILPVEHLHIRTKFERG